MACSGSNPTFNGNISLSHDGATCQNTVTIHVDAPCGSSGYSIKLYRNQGSAPTLVPGEVIYTTSIPDGPLSGQLFQYIDNPPCVRGAYYYQWVILCDATEWATSGVASANSGGPATVTASNLNQDANCNNTTTVQISKPCGECAGTAKLFRNGSQIYTTGVPAGPLIGFTLTYTDTPGDGTWSYIWKIYNDTGGEDAESSLMTITNLCHIFVYNPFTTPLPAGQIEKQIVLVQVQKVGGVYVYTDYQELGLTEQRIEWWYHRNGGCGQFRLLTHNQDFSNILNNILSNSGWEIHVRIKLAGETKHITWYRGIVKYIRREEQGAEQYVEVRGYGYIELLDNVIVQKKYAPGTHVDAIVNDIINSYIKPNTRILRPKDLDPTNGDSGVDASTYVTQGEIHLECSVIKALKFLAELQGNIEFGVDAKGCIYFRNTTSIVQKNFYLDKNITSRVAGGKTFVQANDIKVAGKDFGSVNYLQNRQDVTDITQRGMYESTTELPWVSNDKDASTWADNIIAKNKQSQTWCEIKWNNVDQNLTSVNPIQKIKVFGNDMSNDVSTYDIAKIRYIEGGWITRKEIREIGRPNIQPELDQQLLKATIYAGFYPRDIIEEMELRIKEQVEFLKGKNRQRRYPMDVTNLPSKGHIVGELLHYSKDVTNLDITNNPSELQDITNPRGLDLIWLDNQWVKLSTRRTFNTLPSRGKYVGEIVTLLQDPTNTLMYWTGTAWAQVGTGSGGGGSSGIMEGARVQRSIDLIVTAGGTTVTFDTVLANDNGVFDSFTPSRLTAKTNGYYAISADVLWDKGINGTYREIRIKKTSGVSTKIIAKDRRDDFVHNVQRVNGCDTVILLLIGDYVELEVDTDAQDGGATIKTSSEFSALFSMALVSGNNLLSTSVGTPSGPAGHDLSGTYPSPTVVGLQDVTLPQSPVADGFLKRTSDNLRWEEIDPTSIEAMFTRGGRHQIRIDEWADPTSTVSFCDVTLNPNRHGLVPKPSGWKFEALRGDTAYHIEADEDAFVKKVFQIFRRTGEPVASDAFFTPTFIVGGGATSPTVIYHNGYSYVDLSGETNNIGATQASSSTIYPLETLIDLLASIWLVDVTNTRLWLGWEDGSSVQIQQTEDPKTNKVIAFRFSNTTFGTQPGADTHFMAYVSDGANSTVVDTGITPQANTVYELYIDRSDSHRIVFYINRVAVATITTTLPLTGGISHRFLVTGGVTKHMHMGKFIVRFG